MKLILISILILFFSIPLLSKTIGVCPTCQYNSPADAIKNSDPGDTIEIGPGEYPVGTLTLTKPVSLIAKGKTILDGEKKGHVIDIRSNGVSVTGFEIKNSGVSDLLEFAAIHTEKVKKCEILNNTLYDTTYGIYLAETSDCIVSGNSSDGNAKNEVSGGNGIHLWNCRNIHIKKNRLIRHRDGIYLEFAEDLNIEENESTESLRYGMHFMFSHKNVFLKNHFHHNPTGVAIMYSKGISVIENRFEKNWSLNSYGILLKDISDSRFAGNVFKDNTIGIYAEGSNRNRFSSNEISGNGWGISIFGNCDGNEFEKNNFNENVFDIITNSRKDENQFRNNYWSAYSGYDLNHDGTGDKIHFPVPVFAYWISKYPFLMVLFNSPLVQFLDAAEKAFPLLVPDNLIDPTPRMKPVKI